MIAKNALTFVVALSMVWGGLPVTALAWAMGETSEVSPAVEEMLTEGATLEGGQESSVDEVPVPDDEDITSEVEVSDVPLEEDGVLTDDTGTDLVERAPITEVEEDVLPSEELTGGEEQPVESGDPEALAGSDGAVAVSVDYPFDEHASLREGYALTVQSSVVGDVALYDSATQTNKGMLRSVYAGKKTVVIVGRSTCGNTINAVHQAAELLARSNYANIYVAVLDVEEGGPGFASAFEVSATRMAFYSKQGSDLYNDWAWDTYRGCGESSASSVKLPWIFLLDESGTVLKCTTGGEEFPKMVSETYGISDPELTGYDFTIVGTAKQGEARKLLEMVNSARSAVGVASLKWDATLEQTALQRAAELAASYSHTRPDGSTCFSAWPKGFMAAGENIAWGYANATAVNQGWTDSPGHYANMVNGDVTTFAAACFVDAMGFLNWVECFSTGSGTGFTSEALNGTIARTVTVVPDAAGGINLSCVADVSDGLTLTKGSSRGLGGKVVLNRCAQLASSSLTWASSNGSVVSVSATGTLQAVGVGSATIAVSPKTVPQLSAKLAVRVTQSIASATVGTIASRVYTGKAFAPTVSVTCAGKTLVNGTDYTLSYKNNTNAGTATVTITGKGYYTGSKNVTFAIAKAANPVAVKATKAYLSAHYKPAATTVTAKNVTVTGAQGTVTYTNASEGTTARKFVVNKATGKVTVPKATKVGSYAVKVRITAAGNANYKGASKVVTYKIVVAKAANPLVAKAVRRTVKYSTVKKKAVVVRPMTVTKNQGKVTYARVASGSAKCLTINKTTGKVTVKRGTKKGTYKIKIKVTAAGNANYKAANKTVICKVVVG